jgi:hypothetical protein
MQPETQPDPLINSAEQRRLAGNISSMTLWRWGKAGLIPRPIKIRGRNYRRRGEFMRALEMASNPSPPAPAAYWVAYDPHKRKHSAGESIRQSASSQCLVDAARERNHERLLES